MEDNIRDLAFDGIPNSTIASMCEVSEEYVEKVLASKPELSLPISQPEVKPVLEMVDGLMRAALGDMQLALSTRRLHPSEYAEIVETLANAKAKYSGTGGNVVNVVNGVQPTSFIDTLVD